MITVEVTNRFKGLDLIDRVPEELWTEVCDIVQEAVINTIPKKKKCKNAKWLSEDTLQIAVKIREAKGQGEKERHIHLNAKFQRMASRDTKGTFYAKMGSIKDRNGMDLTEAEDFFFPFIFISWRLITLQYCSGFAIY